MASLGAHLRELRQRRGLSLEEVARATKVAPRYLEGLEADAHADLPAPVFTRGFIRAYCQALGETPDEALARYDARIAAHEAATTTLPAPAAARPATPAPSTARPGGEAEARSRGTVLVSFILLVVLGAALLAVAVITRPGRDERVGRAPTAPPPPAAEPSPATPAGAPAASEAQPPAPPAPRAPEPQPTTVQAPAAKLPAPSPSSAPAAGPISPVAPVAPAAPAPPAPTSPAAPSEPRAAAVASSTQGVSPPYRLVARVSEPTWIRVRTADGATSEETIPSGEVREWVSDRPFVVTIGNAGGVALELNGRALPTLGGHGVVVPRLVLPPDAR